MKASGQFSSSWKAAVRALQASTDTKALPLDLKFRVRSLLSRLLNAWNGRKQEVTLSYSGKFADPGCIGQLCLMMLV